VSSYLTSVIRVPSAPNAVAEWFQEWRRPLRRFLASRRSIPTADLDDVSQEVFLRLLRSERADLVEHPQAYLFRIACNVAAEWNARARCRRPHEAEWLAGLIADDLPDQLVAREEAHEEIRSALRALTSRQQEILKLLYVEGLNRRQIADRLALTPRTVQRQLVKGYEKLRLALRQDARRSRAHGKD
jgi:RNA polymerase sigma factor (sigma-70 family)